MQQFLRKTGGQKFVGEHLQIVQFVFKVLPVGVLRLRSGHQCNCRLIELTVINLSSLIWRAGPTSVSNSLSYLNVSHLLKCHYDRPPTTATLFSRLYVKFYAVF